MNVQRPLVGVGVMIVKHGQVLLGKRKNAHGSGEYSFPGGHLEYMESFSACAIREVQEECGIEITNIRFQFIANVTAYHPKHYVHIGLIADWHSGEPQVKEPDKAEHWAWYDVTDLPKPLFAMCTQAIDSYTHGTVYYDAV